MLPSILIFVFFVWMPLLSNVSYSLFETVGFQTGDFVGLDNFKAVLEDPVFLEALLNTVKYTVWSIVIGFFVPIALAVVLNEIVHLKSLFRVFVYIPNVIPGLAVILMWLFFFDPDGGVLNQIIGADGLWLDNPSLTIPLIVLTMTWKGAGATTLIYLAILQGVDHAQYEAASLDGAVIRHKIKYITIPYLLPTIRMLFILQILSVFQVMYEPLVMTNGGPNNASITLLLRVYQYAFTNEAAYGGVGKAAALGVLISIMLGLLTIVYLRISKKVEDL